MKRLSSFDGHVIISQKPDALTNPSAPAMFLPVLVSVINAIEMITGHKWRVTSYVRMSPSHQHGISVDVAPDISEKDENKYAVARSSDPVLYKRETLIRQLQQVCAKFSPPGYDVGIFMEPDHLHLQVFEKGWERGQLKLFKWGQVKLCYSDSAERSKLPLLS